MVKKLGNKVETEVEYHSKPLLTMREACRVLSIHANTLRRWSNQGRIKAYRVGPAAHRRYRQEDIASLVIDRDKHGDADSYTD